jgi:hypothetical protein
MVGYISSYISQIHRTYTLKTNPKVKEDLNKNVSILTQQLYNSKMLIVVEAKGER